MKLRRFSEKSPGYTRTETQEDSLRIETPGKKKVLRRLSGSRLHTDSDSDGSSSQLNPKRLKRMSALQQLAADRERVKKPEVNRIPEISSLKEPRQQPVDESEASVYESSESSSSHISDFIVSSEASEFEDSDDSFSHAQLNQILDARKDADISSVINPQDNAFLPYLESLVAMLLGLKTTSPASRSSIEDKIFAHRDRYQSSRWPREFREMIERCPFIMFRAMRCSSTECCAACNRISAVKFVGDINTGIEYNWKFLAYGNDHCQKEFLRVLEYSSFGQSSSETVKTVYLGETCYSNVQKYHSLHHWKFRLLKKLNSWLRKNHRDDLKYAIETLREDEDFVGSIEEDYHRIINDAQKGLVDVKDFSFLSD
jgi:hypothetical protein